EARRAPPLGPSIRALPAPPGLAPGQAIALLRSRPPGLVADVNSLYTPFEPETAQIISLPAPDYARHMINWSGDASCGAGFRIGMIDSAIAPNVAALAGTKLHRRSFLGPHALPGGSRHGTPLAALL